LAPELKKIGRNNFHSCNARKTASKGSGTKRPQNNSKKNLCPQILRAQILLLADTSARATPAKPPEPTAIFLKVYGCFLAEQ